MYTRIYILKTQIFPPYTQEEPKNKDNEYAGLKKEHSTRLKTYQSTEYTRIEKITKTEKDEYNGLKTQQNT